MLLSEMPKYGKLTKVVHDICKHVSICFFIEQNPHNIYDKISIDLYFLEALLLYRCPTGNFVFWWRY